MKKKIALVLTGLLILTVMLTPPYFMPHATAPNGGMSHWKIVLAQKGCNARIVGNLTSGGTYIPGTNFNLTCICGLPEPQPLSQFVFWKVNTSVTPTDIHYVKSIDWNKDGKWEYNETVSGDLTTPTPTEPHVWYQHVEYGLIEEQMVVVEVHEQPYDEKQPFFEWQLMMKQHGCEARWTGFFTKDDGYLPGTDFDIYCNRTMQCQIVRTEWCTVPNDIDSELLIIGMPSPVIIDENITQFPWTKTVLGPGPGVNITLELTEVQMYRYVVMGGAAENCAQLSAFPPMWWDVPYASRPPYYTPLQEFSLNITFTQKDPITGIVKLGVPTEKGVFGVRHVFYTQTSDHYYNISTFLREPGCGYLFTGEGKDPVLGDVDVITWNDDTGVYSNKTGELIELGPCLQNVCGPDGIPGTGDLDDIFGNGTSDPPGSSVLYLPTIVHCDWSLPGLPKPDWHLLYEAPYPNLFTTATTNDTVVENQSVFDGIIASAKGEPGEFLAGLDHPGQKVPWEHNKCNAYVTCANAWSRLNIPTSLGDLDLVWRITYKLVREDCIIADINCDEICDIFDITLIGLAYKGKDETYGRPYASSNYDARADLKPLKGEIDIYDLTRCGLDYKKKLTPNCIVRP